MLRSMDRWTIQNPVTISSGHKIMELPITPKAIDFRVLQDAIEEASFIHNILSIMKTNTLIVIFTIVTGSLFQSQATSQENENSEMNNFVDQLRFLAGKMDVFPVDFIAKKGPLAVA